MTKAIAPSPVPHVAGPQQPSLRRAKTDHDTRFGDELSHALGLRPPLPAHPAPAPRPAPAKPVASADAEHESDAHATSASETQHSHRAAAGPAHEGTADASDQSTGHADGEPATPTSTPQHDRTGVDSSIGNENTYANAAMIALTPPGPASHLSPPAATQTSSGAPTTPEAMDRHAASDAARVHPTGATPAPPARPRTAGHRAPASSVARESERQPGASTSDEVPADRSEVAARGDDAAALPSTVTVLEMVAGDASGDADLHGASHASSGADPATGPAAAVPVGQFAPPAASGGATPPGTTAPPSATNGAPDTRSANADVPQPGTMRTDRVTVQIPTELGAARIQISVSHGSVATRILMPDAASASQLSSATGELHDALTRQGFDNIKIAIPVPTVAVPEPRALADTSADRMSHQSPQHSPTSAHDQPSNGRSPQRPRRRRER